MSYIDKIYEFWKNRVPEQIKRPIWVFKDFYIPIYIERKKPMIIYQMGKVGSKSIINSLKSYGHYPLFHFHLLLPNNIKRSNNYKKSISSEEFIKDYSLQPEKNRLYTQVVQKNKKANILTIVREPIARKISAFFQAIDRFHSTMKKENRFDLQILNEIFLKKHRHERPLTWFDKEMKRILEIDVYEYEFPKEKGHQIIEKGPYQLLILKLEIPDERMEKAIIDFLDLDDDFELQRSNVGKKKDYAELYQKFKENVELPQSYIEKMLNSKYTKHFYTEEEIQKARERWS